jgi:hypothetical protein
MQSISISEIFTIYWQKCELCLCNGELEMFSLLKLSLTHYCYCVVDYCETLLSVAQTKIIKTTISYTASEDHARGSRCGSAIDLEETFLWIFLYPYWLESSHTLILKNYYLCYIFTFPCVILFVISWLCNKNVK